MVYHQKRCAQREAPLPHARCSITYLELETKVHRKQRGHENNPAHLWPIIRPKVTQNGAKAEIEQHNERHQQMSVTEKLVHSSSEEVIDGDKLTTGAN